MHNVFIYAGIAAIGNGIFVYGQRSAPVANNPFLFMAGAVSICAILFVVSSSIFGGTDNTAYLRANLKPVAISAVGFFFTFVGFYLMYTRVGASSYTVYAVLSILTTSVAVGMLIFRESFTIYHIISIILAVLAVAFFGYGQNVVGR